MKVAILAAAVADATAELNGRQRGRTERLERLRLAGAPVGDRAALEEWRAAAADRLHEAEGGVYHACVVSAKHADPRLPIAGRHGCRVERVPIHAFRAVDAAGNPVLDAGSPVWVVQWTNCGVGWMADIYDRESASAAEAEDRARAALLRRDDCFRTRAEAVAAASEMLAARQTRSMT